MRATDGTRRAITSGTGPSSQIQRQAEPTDLRTPLTRGNANRRAESARADRTAAVPCHRLNSKTILGFRRIRTGASPCRRRRREFVRRQQRMRYCDITQPRRNQERCGQRPPAKTPQAEGKKQRREDQRSLQGQRKRLPCRRDVRNGQSPREASDAFRHPGLHILVRRDDREPLGSKPLSDGRRMPVRRQDTVNGIYL